MSDENWKEKYEELEEELNEFQEMSSQLEAELEANLAEAMSKVSSLEKKNVELESKLANGGATQANGATSSAMVEDLQKQLRDAEADRTALRDRVRALENANDSLENRVREAQATAATATNDAERALEDRALVTTELEEARERSAETVQRLRDELRDVKSELNVRSASATSASAPPVANGHVHVESTADNCAPSLVSAREMLETIRALKKMLLDE